MRAAWERRCALAAIALATLLAPATVAAAPLTDATRLGGPTIAGTLQGASEWSPAVAHCDVAPISSADVAGTFDASFIGRGDYSGSIVRTSAGTCPLGFGSGSEFAVEGTLTFSGPGGSFVATIGPGSTGSASESPHAAAYDFHLVLTITSGIHRYAGAGGSLTLDYSTSANFTFDCPCAPADAGTLTGSVAHGADSAT
jgi:hypothetical protein